MGGRDRCDILPPVVVVQVLALEAVQPSNLPDFVLFPNLLGCFRNKEELTNLELIEDWRNWNDEAIEKKKLVYFTNMNMSLPSSDTDLRILFPFLTSQYLLSFCILHSVEECKRKLFHFL